MGTLALAHGLDGHVFDLDLIWRVFRCFDLEHTFRFLKLTLGWDTLLGVTDERATAELGACSPTTPITACPVNVGTHRDALQQTASTGRFQGCCSRSAPRSGVTTS